MDTEPILGLSDELNSEFSSAMEDFVGLPDVVHDEEESSGHHSVELDASFEDKEEEATVEAYFNGDPCCALGPEKSACWTRFGRDVFLAARRESLEIDKNEADLAILGSIRTIRSLPNPSGRTTMNYQFLGSSICKAAYLFLHALGIHRFRNLVSYFDAEGVSARVHKNSRKRPQNCTEKCEVEKIKVFIETFADNHALPLPGRLPAHKDYKVMLLPSDMSKSAVYRLYSKSCEAGGLHCVSRRTFTSIWGELCPYIVAMKPATDLCFTCQQNSSLLMKSAAMPDSVKSQRLHDAQTHLDKARTQREHYNEQCSKAKDALSDTNNTSDTMHYSFDYAQQIHYPFDCQQSGPIFFKTPRKCGIFGVSCEATSSHVITI